MRLVHFELSCVAVSGEPSVPLFCMFYKLISDGDWFTFAKWQNSVSRPCYSFMPTSTYPKEWKSRFIFVSAAMIPESPPPRDAEAAIEDSIPALSADETTSGSGDSRDVKWLEGLFRPGALLLWKKVRGLLLMERRVPLILFKLGHSDCDDEEDLESRLVRKRKAVSPKPVPTPRDIRQRLRSARGQKVPPKTKVVSELPPIGVKGSLSKHLRSSSLGSSADRIEIPTGPSSSRVRDKTPEVSIARIASAFEVSPHHATRTSKPSQFEGLARRSPLAPLFADALPFTYVTKWKITHSLVIGTPETARDFLSHAVPPSHRFKNSALRDDLFEDQYSMSLCESFFRGAGMLQRVDDLRKENEELKGELKTSQYVAAELRCQVVEAERKLQEEKGAGAMLERRERAWEREMAVLVEEKEELAAELKHLKEVGSVSQEQLNTMYADYGITSDDNQRLAKEKHWLITEGFGAFLTAVS
ncbi:hypothetical protein HanPSC8_Chr01g0029961 [Helianthus annuus]|nr:hypothetical protein HanPSC8_Chr01g0029961 [Helianthus annuus]